MVRPIMNAALLAQIQRLIASGQYAQALQMLEPELAAHDSAELWLALADIRRGQNLASQAFAAYLETVRRDPAQARAHYWLSVLLEGNHRLDALRHAQWTLELLPEDPAAQRQLRRIYSDLAARDFGPELIQQLSRQPAAIHDLLNALTLLPAIPENPAEIEICTRVIERTVAALADQPLAFEADLPAYDLAFPQILTYYGLDGTREKRLRQAYARLFAQIKPLTMPAGRSGRIGFVAGRGRTPMLLRFQGGLMRQLSELSPQLEWVLAAPASHEAEIAQQLPGWRYLPLPEHLPQAAIQLAAANCDLLYYWEYGLDPLSYFLSFYKPARVQCIGGGWPATSGVATVDYFLSCDHFEGPDASRFYSEKLLTLSGLPYQGLMPALPEQPLPRSHWGFGPEQRIYLCPQDPLKLHPSMDAIFANLLAADPQAVLVLIAYQPDIGRRLYQRLQRHSPQHAARVRMLPRMRTHEYLSLMLAADVALDSWPYGGGGTNTDLLACGTPVVTLPGPQMRSRITASVLQTIGLPELIADAPETYLEIALRSARDQSQRPRMREIMRTQGRALVEESLRPADFVALLEEMIHR